MRRAVLILVAACSAPSVPPDAGNPLADGGVVDAGVIDAGPPCGPYAATHEDAGPQFPTPATGCTRDLDCDAGKFCYATSERCVLPSEVGFNDGAGKGGLLPDGHGCDGPLEISATCDATSL